MLSVEEIVELISLRHQPWGAFPPAPWLIPQSEDLQEEESMTVSLILYDDGSSEFSIS